MVKYTECKTALQKTSSGKKKRVLMYVNNKNNTKLPVKVGARGGLSVKSRSSKNRRYIKGVCKKTKCDGQFWKTVENMRKSNQKKR